MIATITGPVCECAKGCDPETTHKQTDQRAPTHRFGDHATSFQFSLEPFVPDDDVVVRARRAPWRSFYASRAIDATNSAKLPTGQVVHFRNGYRVAVFTTSGSHVAWLMVAFAVLMGAFSYLSNYIYQQRSVDLLQWENSLLQRQIGQGELAIEQRLRSLGLNWDNYSERRHSGVMYDHAILSDTSIWRRTRSSTDVTH